MLRRSSLRTSFFASALIAASALSASCATVDDGAEHEPVDESSDLTPEDQSALFARPYLRFGSVPSSIALLAAPPSGGSPAMEADRAANAQALTQRASPRWNAAATDADLGFPAVANNFSCALGAPISQRQTPALYRMMRRAALDAGGATSEAKAHYDRPRPFEVNRQPICTPRDARALRADGSYPSGHSAVGWAWALLLSELSPEQKEQVLARGHEFGQSRVVCNVHWQSDVDAGRVVAQAVVERLHRHAEFRRDFEAARKEIAGARRRGLPPARGCR